MIFAIGDVHGKLNLLEMLHKKIMAHSEQFEEVNTIVMLGDYIDRGSQSKEVLDFLMSEPFEGFNHVFLKGNHEDLMLKTLTGNPDRIRAWLENGGDQTCKSFGIDPTLIYLDGGAWKDLLKPYIPWLTSLKPYYQTRKHVFVHAGIDPDIFHDMSLQREEVLLWIRHRFLKDRRDYGFTVVHGHTPTPDDAPETFNNRIGIDTGAVWSTILTAVCVDENDSTPPEFISAKLYFKNS